MAVSLIDHEIIKTTLPKAKELRPNRGAVDHSSKTDNVANRRLAFNRLAMLPRLGSCFLNWAQDTPSDLEAILEY